MIFNFIRIAWLFKVVLKDGILEGECLDGFNADEHRFGPFVLVVALNACLCVDLRSLLSQGQVLCDAGLLSRISVSPAISPTESRTKSRTEIAPSTVS